MKRFLKRCLKYIGYPFEAAFFLIIPICGVLFPFSWNSAIGGWLFSTLGPLIKAKNKIIYRNLELAGFDYNEAQKKKLIKKMWENLGRTSFEYTRLPGQDPFGPNSPYTIEGIEHIDKLINDGKPGLLFSAHMGNWEVGTHVAQKRGLVTAQVTRFLNNPLVRYMVNTIHGRVARKVIPKSDAGARDIIRELKAGNHVSMLGDQKMDQGESIPFFTKNAMTAKAFARMVLKFDCPLLPFHVIRQKGVRCKVIYYPPLEVPHSGTSAEKTTALLCQMNTHIENWIKEIPDQWFWVHRRWPKDHYNSSQE